MFFKKGNLKKKNTQTVGFLSAPLESSNHLHRKHEKCAHMEVSTLEISKGLGMSEVDYSSMHIFAKLLRKY